MNRNMNPWYVTGLMDADGCLGVNIYPRKGKFQVIPFIEIALNKIDKNLLKKIKIFFNAGNIYDRKYDCSLRITKLNEINIIINTHFEYYPLVTQKKLIMKYLKILLRLLRVRNIWLRKAYKKL